MHTPLIKKVFYSQVFIFILIICYFLIPWPPSIKRSMFFITAILGFIFLLLGVLLKILAKKEHGKPKFFLMLTAYSAILPFVSAILHNLFYGLAVFFNDNIVLKYFFEGLHVSFFIIAVVVAPLLFIIGSVGTIIYLRK